jgi:cytoskeletal protein CcmA (bactofilin family)
VDLVDAVSVGFTMVLQTRWVWPADVECDLCWGAILKASESDAKRAVPAPPRSKRPSARSAAPSIISPDLVVNGTLSSAGEIQIDGRIEGIVQCTTLVVGDKALIHGDVFAQHVTVRGRIEGNIRSKMVLFCATCHVEGDILHQAFAVEPGAFLDGNCRHSDNPLDGNTISNGVVVLANRLKAEVGN